jgi:hypothetical protein
MKSIIFIIISILFVGIGIMIQAKMLKKRHPNAELLIEVLKLLDIQQHSSAKGNKGDGKN